MRKILSRLLIVALATATVAAAQGPRSRRGESEGKARSERFQERILDRLAQRLSLTDSQKQQAQSIFDSARQSAEPLAGQLRESRQALRDAVKSGRSSAEIDQLAATQGSLIGQAVAIHTKALAQFYSLLTPDQREKFTDVEAAVRGMMEGRARGFGRRPRF